MRKLSELQTGECGYITKVLGRGAFRRRLSEMGFVSGKKVKVIKNAPLKDPIEYEILDYNVTLRRHESANILVSAQKPENGKINGAELLLEVDSFKPVETYKEKGHNINIALVGNPNAGKTTIFNYASKSNEHTGNYSGVTVDSKTAKVEYGGYLLNITDLPGTYSISAFSPEELFVRDYIIKEVPDVVINVVDASNLERNLFLTTQLIDMDVKVILALNMYDELQKSNNELDFVQLGKLLGIPIVPTVGAKGRGIKELFQKVISLYKDQEPIYRHIHINYGFELEKSLTKIQDEIKKPINYEITDKVSSRYLALKLLERDRHISDYILNAQNYKEIEEVAKKEVVRIKDLYDEEPVTEITDAKYGFIGGALKETFSLGEIDKRKITDVLDAFFTHRLFGFPVFFLFLWIMFASTFKIGEYPMNWIDSGVSLLSNYISEHMAEGSFKDLLVDGILGGVGGVIVFLPNILILFFFISFMEDSGYMARAVFIMDRIMHKIGLHGKSFISLIMGFGCNVPAIMSTRTIEDRQNRLLTMLINPFMSCSARLPVYLLIIGAVFPSHRGTILFSIYMLGIVLAIVVALLFKKTLFSGEGSPFVMELPPYRMPTMRSTLRHMWAKGIQYLKKMGGVILVASIILWALGYFPRQADYSNEVLAKKELLENVISNGSAQEKEVAQKELKNIERHIEAERLQQSYIGRIGKAIEPVISPLGFDWKMGVCLLTGIAAKEVVVSTMGVLYQADDDGAGQSLEQKIRQERFKSGKKVGQKIFTPVVAFAFLVFILIYFPCVAVVAAIKRESGSTKWAVFLMAYTTGLAWLMAFVTYNVGSLFFKI